MAGKTKRSGDGDREGHIRVHLNIEQKQFSQPAKEMTNTRPRGLRIWYNRILEAWEKLIHEKNLKSKISLHTHSNINNKYFFDTII